MAVGTTGKHGGFTLVELLVVIGVIALLIAILLPVLNQAREQARMVKCMSNVRQLMISVNYYANDYRQFLPPSEIVTASNGGFGQPALAYLDYPGTWADARISDPPLLGKYSGNPAVSANSVWGYVPAKGNTLWRCPSDQNTLADSPGRTTRSYAPPGEWGNGTGPSDDLQIFVRVSNPGRWLRLKRMSMVKDAARTVGIIEGSPNRWQPGSSWTSTTSMYSGFTVVPGTDFNASNAGLPNSAFNHAIRHKRELTVAGFMDGHVEALRNTPQTGGLGLRQVFVIDKQYKLTTRW